MDLSIIIPAHNEEKRIGATLEEYGRFFKDKKKKKKLNSEIIVVLNACTDNTLDIIKKAKKKFRDIKYIEFERGGKGFAIIQGFKIAKGKLQGFVDADMATRPEAFYDLYKNIDRYHGIIGSRWKRGAQVNRSLGKLIRSKGFNIYTRFLFLLPYEDTQCGAKIFRREAIQDILDKINITRWAFDVCLLYHLKKKRCKIKEWPTIWEDKEGSKIMGPKGGLKISFQMASAIMRLRFLYSPFRFIVRLYDKLPEKVKIHSW